MCLSDCVLLLVPEEQRESVQRVARLVRLQQGCMVAIGNRCFRHSRYTKSGSGTNEPAVKFNPGTITYDC